MQGSRASRDSSQVGRLRAEAAASACAGSPLQWRGLSRIPSRTLCKPQHHRTCSPGHEGLCRVCRFPHPRPKLCHTCRMCKPPGCTPSIRHHMYPGTTCTAAQAHQGTRCQEVWGAVVYGHRKHTAKEADSAPMFARLAGSVYGYTGTSMWAGSQGTTSPGGPLGPKHSG